MSPPVFDSRHKKGAMTSAPCLINGVPYLPERKVSVSLAVTYFGHSSDFFPLPPRAFTVNSSYLLPFTQPLRVASIQAKSLEMATDAAICSPVESWGWMSGASSSMPLNSSLHFQQHQ